LIEPIDLFKVYQDGEWVGCYSRIEKDVIMTTDHLFDGEQIVFCGLAEKDDNATLSLVQHDPVFKYAIYVYRGGAAVMPAIMPLRGYRDGLATSFWKAGKTVETLPTSAVSGTNYAVCRYNGTGPGWSGYPLNDGFNTYGVFDCISGKNVLFSVPPASYFVRSFANATNMGVYQRPISIFTPFPIPTLTPPTLIRGFAPEKGFQGARVVAKAAEGLQGLEKDLQYEAEGFASSTWGAYAHKMRAKRAAELLSKRLDEAKESMDIVDIEVDKIGREMQVAVRPDHAERLRSLDARMKTIDKVLIDVQFDEDGLFVDPAPDIQEELKLFRSVTDRKNAIEMRIESDASSEDTSSDAQEEMRVYRAENDRRHAAAVKAASVCTCTDKCSRCHLNGDWDGRHTRCVYEGKPVVGVIKSTIKGKNKRGKGRVFKWHRTNNGLSSEEYEEILQLFYDLNERWPDEKEMNDAILDRLQVNEAAEQYVADDDNADNDQAAADATERAWAKYDRIQGQIDAYLHGGDGGDGSTVERLTAGEKMLLGFPAGKKKKNVEVVGEFPLPAIVEEVAAESSEEEESEETLLARLEAIRLKKKEVKSVDPQGDIARKYSEMKKNLSNQAYEAECAALEGRIKDF